MPTDPDEAHSSAQKALAVLISIAPRQPWSVLTALAFLLLAALAAWEASPVFEWKKLRRLFTSVLVESRADGLPWFVERHHDYTDCWRVYDLLVLDRREATDVAREVWPHLDPALPEVQQRLVYDNKVRAERLIRASYPPLAPNE